MRLNVFDNYIISGNRGQAMKPPRQPIVDRPTTFTGADQIACRCNRRTNTSITRSFTHISRESWTLHQAGKCQQVLIQCALAL